MNKFFKLSILAILLLQFSFIQAGTKDTKIPKEQRMEWWQDARFGMFIHWGIYSVPAGQYQGKEIRNSAEWIMNKGEIPLGEYEKFSDQFNPTQFDAKAFVGLAKEAGMKYMVITAKHHDGFSMFNSKSNPFNIVNATPFKRDVLKELSAECQRQGIRFGFYYSQAQDWSHPGGLGNNWDKKMQHVTNDVYVREKALPEVNQLLTDYGPISIFWWDTPRQMTKEVVDSLYRVTGLLQPGIITNDRLGEGYEGDYKTFERGIPKMKPDDKYWEICQPISGSWGYKRSDTIYQSSSKLVHNLVDVASKGGNYLLNVSPTADGILMPGAVASLKGVGAWMKKNSEAIYGTQASPCTNPDWGRITMKTVKGKPVLYLHVFDWKKDGQLTVQLKNKVKSCYLLSNAKQKFKTQTTDAGIVVTLKGNAPDSIASVIVLNLNELPNAILPTELTENSAGVIELTAERAQFKNLDAQGAEYQDNKNCIAMWTSEKAMVYWTFTVKTPGTFKATTEVSGLKASLFNVSVDNQKNSIDIPASGNYGKFISLELGTFRFDKAGVYTLMFKPDLEKWTPTNMRGVVLSPVK